MTSNLPVSPYLGSLKCAVFVPSFYYFCGVRSPSALSDPGTSRQCHRPTQKIDDEPVHLEASACLASSILRLPFAVSLPLGLAAHLDPKTGSSPHRS